MDNQPKSKIKGIWSYISNVISWTTFVLLLICAILLLYYFIATQIYARKGSGYEPAFSLYTIVSPSMTPNINVYDVVVDVKAKSPDDIKIGDVITFNSNNPNLIGKTITHRVIAITKDKDGNYLYQTKGDANIIEDDKPIPYNLIIGKVAIRIPQLGRVQFLLASSFGWFILILIPALYIIIKDIIKVIRISKMSEEEYEKYKNELKNKKKKKLFSFEDTETKENINNVDDSLVNSNETYYDNSLVQNNNELEKNQDAILNKEENDKIMNSTNKNKYNNNYRKNNKNNNKK